MAYLLMIDCQVEHGRMQEFTSHVQQWEQDALQDEDAPNWHAVYLAANDPARVVVITEFESRERAARFEDRGLIADFRQAVLGCIVGEPGFEMYDLFYAATPSGPAVTFGEQTWRD